MNIVKIFYTDGRTEEVNKKMDLAEMQNIVGGYIERVPSNIAHRSLIINEEGYLDGLPNNIEATKLLHTDVLKPSEFLQGNILLAKY